MKQFSSGEVNTEGTHDRKQPPDDRQKLKVGDKIRANLHRGQIDDVIIKVVVETDSGIRLQVDVIGLEVTALIDLSQVWSADH